MQKRIQKINRVKGELNLPGDKSISHRSVIFSSMASGRSVIRNISNGEDVNTTIKIMEKLGAKVKISENELLIDGCGFKGFIKTLGNLDCGNSGTSTRLISGLLATQNFTSILTGDDSVSKRPMKRVIDPLIRMGAKIESSNNFTLPLTIIGNSDLIPIEYKMPVASAQVKSAVLIAGLHCDIETIIIENEQTRNHTEKMLGLPVTYENGKIISESSKKYYPISKQYFIPGDISSSAFLVVLTLLTQNSELIIKNVSLNQTRTGFIEILKQMGAKIHFENINTSSNEEYGDMIIKSSDLKNIDIDPKIIPNIIDEIPILSVAGVFAAGDFKINNAKELRVKESDRINSVCSNMKLLGLNVNEEEDGFTISGSIKYSKPVFQSYNDHRIAMACAILSMLLDNGGEVSNFECVNISNPKFEEQIKSVCI
jgi:3-phosphoshikimate 1-carboxyvinyltransferase